MRAEENPPADGAAGFPRPRGTAEPVAVRSAVPDTGPKTRTSRPAVPRAERGTANTGTVHGGRPATAIEPPCPVDGGADGDV